MRSGEDEHCRRLSTGQGAKANQLTSKGQSWIVDTTAAYLVYLALHGA